MASRSGTIVLGLGETGRSCVSFLHGREPLAALDTRSSPPGLAELRRAHPNLRLIDAADWDLEVSRATRVLVSPSIDPEHCLVRRARAGGAAIASDIELFLAAARAPVIGITGTNGKSTVTALVGELLAATGRSVGVGGNLGPPALDLLHADRDAYVLELSSFQLQRLRRPALAVACVLNVSPDHLDRHHNIVRYAACKRRIYGGAEVVVFNADDTRTWPKTGGGIALGRGEWRIDGNTFHLGGETMTTQEVALKGRHNHFNVLAAAAIAAAAGVAVTDMKPVLKRFAGLPHRCTEVARKGGVTFVDDSKATNVGACRAALEGLGNDARNLVWIAGGDAKDATFEELAAPARRHVAHALLIGRDAARLAEGLGDAVPVTRVADMQTAVREAWRLARPTRTVLLSPACASFDMYDNYEARGRDFAAAAIALGARAAEGSAGA
ncbi:MAG: UDP-N-acetylmuramoyl-L-alanine--D-glutamate ligase [Gammaproteobacteria bacterium]|nr:UDP-N-acetylmuramoyl-L-alanine--D-glutamate ligase [Gammaproteobacteria bacterium]MYB36397.1 UDP-N-acetylmuramoyl-L-alanine--D-glutamate ligase [Gammaproteobacteria bacterium]